jgi:hypothetical protein
LFSWYDFKNPKRIPDKSEIKDVRKVAGCKSNIKIKCISAHQCELEQIVFKYIPYTRVIKVIWFLEIK